MEDSVRVKRLQSALPFVPVDRIQELMGARPLASTGWGAVLFADLSGFTLQSRQLVEEHGPRRGAERATQILNEILERLLAPVHDWGGVVLSFSGDGFLCWFPIPEEAPQEKASLHVAIGPAVYCAFAMQAAMSGLQRAHTAYGLGLKISLAGGFVHRFVVGDPDIQLLDALAGAPVALAVAGEGCAVAGEVLVEQSALRAMTTPESATPEFEGSELTTDRVVITQWRSLVEFGTRVAVVEPGHNLPQPPATARAATIHQSALGNLSAAELRPWLPPFMWERLATGQAEFLAELRPAVAIFARFAPAQMGEDEQSRRDLNAYIAWAQRVFAAADGVIIQVTLGDKGSYLYGVLGAPAQHDDTALRAAVVAQQLAMGPGKNDAENGLQNSQGSVHAASIARENTHENVHKYNSDFRPQAQVGMAQGRVRTGAYGSRTRRTYGVQGNAVNLAARLMMLARPGEILVDPAAATLLETHYQLVPLSGAELRGFTAPMNLFRLAKKLADTAFITRFGVRFLLEKLIDRYDEDAKLAHAYQSAQAGAAVVLHIVGDAGMGKSALLWQFAQRIEGRVIPLDCRAVTTGSGYALIIMLLGQLLALSSREGEPSFWNDMMDALRVRGIEGGAPLAVLAEAMGQSGPDNAAESAAGLSLEQRRELLAGLLLAALRPVDANPSPVAAIPPSNDLDEPRLPVVLLDDLHTADPASRAVLARLFEQLLEPTSREGEVTQQPGILFVTAQRQPPVESDPTNALAGEIIQLAGLTPAEGRALLAQRLHGPPDPLTTDLLAHYSQGNPLYLTLLAEELVNRGDLRPGHGAETEEETGAGVEAEGAGFPSATWQVAEDIFGRLQAAGCLQRVDGWWRLRPDAGLGAADLGLPDTLHRLVLTQVDRLPVSVGLTLKVIAVANMGIAETLINQAHPNTGNASVGHDLELLTAHGFVHVEAHDEARVFRIANSVVHDVVYESLLDRQRKELHRALAAGYQSLAPLPIELVAYHLFRSDVHDAETRQQACAALEQAVETAQRRYALEAALGYLDCLLTLAHDWLYYRKKFDLLHALGLRHEQRVWLEEMEAVPAAPVAELALCQARYYEAISDYAAAQQWIFQALDAARHAEDVLEQATAHCLLGQVARRRGDHGTARQHYLDALAAIHADRDAERYGEIAYGLGIAARHQGDFPEARRRLTDALAFFQRQGARHDEALSLTALGVLSQMERQYRDAFTYHDRALNIRRAINDWPGEGASLVSMAQLRRAQGFHADAIRLLEAARYIHRSLRDRWWENRILNEIGVIYLIAGQLLQAQEALVAGLELARAIGDGAGEMVLLLNLGQVLRDRGQPDEAGRVLEQSLAMAQSRGEKYVEAQCKSDMARVYLLTGAQKMAIVTAQQAIDLLAELGLETASTADLATQAEAYLHLEKIPEALACAARIVTVLDDSQGEGADFPQRDYWIAYTVFQAAGQAEQARHAQDQSRRHLQIMADRFQDPEMQAAFLSNIAVNRAIQSQQSAPGGACTT